MPKPVTPYAALKAAGKADPRSEGTANLLAALIDNSLDDLGRARTVTLASVVRGKEYFAFSKGTNISRPVRCDLWDLELTRESLKHFISGSYRTLPSRKLDKVLYTMGMSFCCATDIIKSGDKKTPATFFEVFVGSIFARELGVNPRRDCPERR